MAALIETLRNTENPLLLTVLAVAVLAGGFLIGLLIEWLALRWLRRLAAANAFDAEQFHRSAVRGLWRLLPTAGGVYLVVLRLPLNSELSLLLHNSVLVVALLSVTISAARATAFLVRRASRNGGILPGVSIFSNLARGVVLLIGSLIILQVLGIPITPALTALGVGGLAVALALQDTLGNLFAGLQIIAARQISVGDYIQLETGQAGYVVDIAWRTTSIRQLENNMVIIPNARLASAVVVNYARPDNEMAVLVDFSVARESDLQEVEQATVEIAREVQREVTGGVAEFEPFIRYGSVGERGVSFTVILRGQSFVDQFLIKHEFIKRIQLRFHELGIELAYPSRNIYFREFSAASAGQIPAVGQMHKKAPDA